MKGDAEEKESETHQNDQGNCEKSVLEFKLSLSPDLDGRTHSQEDMSPLLIPQPRLAVTQHNCSSYLFIELSM